MSGCPAMPGTTRRCPPSICDCFIDWCLDCANGTCSSGGLHPEAFVVGNQEDES